MIVGERGPAPKATPTYPEICLHSLQDLDILNGREKVSFKVGDEVKRSTKRKLFLSGRDTVTVTASWNA